MFKLKQMASVAAAAVSLAFGMTSATAAPTITFENVVLGLGTVSVDVVVGNLGNEIVSAYDLDVAFNTGALTFLDLTFGLGLGDESLLEVLNEGPVVGAGLVDFAALSLLSDGDLFLLQDGLPVTLATLIFTGSDVTSLAFVNWGTVNNNTNDVKGRNALQIIPVGQIPEPATYGLIGMALLAAGVARRRQA